MSKYTFLVVLVPLCIGETGWQKQNKIPICRTALAQLKISAKMNIWISYPVDLLSTNKGDVIFQISRVIRDYFGRYITYGAQLLYVVLYLMGGPHKGIEYIFWVFVGYVYLVLELGKCLYLSR